MLAVPQLSAERSNDEATTLLGVVEDGSGVRESRPLIDPGSLESVRLVPSPERNEASERNEAGVSGSIVQLFELGETVEGLKLGGLMLCSTQF